MIPERLQTCMLAVPISDTASLHLRVQGELDKIQAEVNHERYWFYGSNEHALR